MAHPSHPLTGVKDAGNMAHLSWASGVPSGKCGCHEQFPPSQLSKNYVGKRRKALPRVSTK